MELLGFYTTKGTALAAKVLAGSAYIVTRVTAGSGVTDASATVLAQEQQTLAVGTLKREGTTVTLPVTLAAAQAETDYSLWEVGVYAQDPEEGEVLCRVYRLDEAIQIRTGDRLTIRLWLEEIVSEAAEITVTCSPAGILTEGDLSALLGAEDGIAELDGSGKVPVEQMPYAYGTADMEAGVTALATGQLYFVYE